MAESKPSDQLNACRTQIDAIVVDTLHQLNGVYVDLGYSDAATEKEYNDLIEDTREFFRSKLLPRLALRGNYILFIAVRS
jgi:hypothetical protein